jgi:hypothetical protein
MAATSRVLSDYYRSLDRILARTEDSYQAQFVLVQAPPDDLHETRAQIQLRVDLADEIGKLSALFQKITGSAAASDASASAAKMGVELDALRGLSGDDAETKGLAVGIEEIVALVQQRDEREAARKIGPLCHQLSVFFDSEKTRYDSIQESYLKVARSVSKSLVDKDQVDTSPVFASALEPFGLAPAIDAGPLKAGMRSYLLAQIESNYALRLAQGQRSTEALSAALKEMDARIGLVAHDKAMQIREPPYSLDTVKVWISEVNK